MRRRVGWLIGLILAVGTVNCESPPENGSSSEASETAGQTTKQQSPRTKKKRDRLSSGPFAYVESIGQDGEEPGHLHEPIGLAVGVGGKLYVSEGGNNRLQTFDADGESQTIWAEGIGRPMHIASDEQGQLVVPAYNEDVIHVYDGPNSEVDSFGGDWVDAPAGVDVGPDGRYVIADFYNHRFHILSHDGTVEQTIGKKGKKDGQFTYPTDVEVTPDGDIWVADAYAHRIQVFAPNGTHNETIGQKGTEAPGEFHVATGIDRGPDGNLYVADFKNNRIQVLKPEGTPVAVIDGEADGDESMTHPTDVVATEKKLYVVDHGHHQIDMYVRTESESSQ